MRKISLFLAMMLAGCAGGLQPIDPQKVLSGMEGPKVPSIQDALTQSAQESEKQGNYRQAIVLYQQILDKHPENKDAALSLAEAFRRTGQYDQSIVIYDGLIKQYPDMIGAKEGKGLALLAKSDFETPGKLFEEVMQADPKRWKTLNALGILFVTRSLQPEAQQYFNEALKYSPGNPSILNNLGLSQALDRNNGAALATLGQAAAATTPGSAERKRIDLNIALVYAISGRMNEAKAIAETYLSGPALDNNMGLYAHLANDDQMARAYLNMALTNSKIFYEKAWDNLQALGGAEEPKAQPPAAEPAPPEHVLKAPSDGISKIIGNSLDTSDEQLKDKEEKKEKPKAKPEAKKPAPPSEPVPEGQNLD